MRLFIGILNSRDLLKKIGSHDILDNFLKIFFKDFLRGKNLKNSQVCHEIQYFAKSLSFFNKPSILMTKLK